MTATDAENQRASDAVAAGVAAASQHERAAEAQHKVFGSAVVVEAASTSDDVAVAWRPADTTAQAALQPSEPPAVNSYDRHPADPT
jgi:hypothetical protein